MDVPALKTFEFSDWEAVGSAFQNAPSLDMSQAWLEKPDETFRPATVRVGWREDVFFVWARLVDDQKFTQATQDNQHLWKLGDVFEMFLRDVTREDYLELHVAPSGHRLQLRFLSAETIYHLRDRQLRLTDLMVSESLFDLSVRETAEGWDVLAGIPLKSFGSSGETFIKKSLLASFSRYDYDDDKTPPVLSSTSAHTELNYHRQQEWRMLNFVE